ncbi:MAG: prevent-host-death protein [Mycobacterium sp.]|nr:prevent-host-death protein [Mycobacterium sp.]
MTTILVMETTSLATIKAQLSSYVARVHDQHERIMITRNGEPAAILMSPDDLESLEETLAILGDPQTMAALAEAGNPDTPSYTGEEMLAMLAERKRVEATGDRITSDELVQRVRAREG